MNQSLQIRKVIDQEIGRDFLESLRRVTVSDTTRLNGRIPPRENVDGGISNHPSPFPIALSIRQDLKNADGIGFLMIKAVTAVYRSKMVINAKSIQHGAAEMNRFIRQNSHLAATRQPVKRLTNTGIQRGVVQHMTPIVGEKHLQAGLNIDFSSFGAERPLDQHQCTISDKTSNLVLRQNRQIELMPNVVYGRRQILFGV